MILIRKTKEPKSWTSHRNTPGADYEANEDLRKALLADQGYLCAYCMRRIPKKDEGSDETSRIEHIIPQESLSRKERMDFSNLVICCPGALEGVEGKKTHCDRHKGKRKISFSLFDPVFIDSLNYNNDGTIVSTNETWNKEINNILNLNISLLKKCRKEVKKGIITVLGKRKWTKADILALQKIYESKDSDGHYVQYCGIGRWYLSKKVRVKE